MWRSHGDIAIWHTLQRSRRSEKYMCINFRKLRPQPMANGSCPDLRGIVVHKGRSGLELTLTPRSPHLLLHHGSHRVHHISDLRINYSEVTMQERNIKTSCLTPKL